MNGDSDTRETKALPVLQAAGFSASVDAFAWEADPDQSRHQMWLWLISLLGSQQAVKALWARLIKGESMTLRFETLGRARFCALAPEGPKGWCFFTAGLPASAGYQGVLVPECALYTSERPDFLLLPRRPEEAASLHYRFLNRRLDLPLHPSWATWLWERALRAGEALGLESRGVHGYHCIPNAEALAAELSTAVRKGLLPLPEIVGRDSRSASPHGKPEVHDKP